jgi:uncharacterized alkaline shock family protein YloU
MATIMLGAARLFALLRATHVATSICHERIKYDTINGAYLQNRRARRYLMNEEAPMGAITVSPRAIASIASEAVLGCYGVVGMSSATLRDGIAEILQVGNYHHGVEVRLGEDSIAVDLYVVVEYGLRISEVAHNVMGSVKFAVERALGTPVAEVNVHVQGLRVSSRD